MLGFRFCPRLRDFPDRKLASIEPATAYPTLQPLLGRRIKVDVIREHWHEVVRLVASLKAGTVAPSAMLRKLAAYERQNQLDLALQELGRIERTLFISRTEQRGAAPRSRSGYLHVQAGKDRGPRHRGAAIQGLGAEPMRSYTSAPSARSCRTSGSPTPRRSVGSTSVCRVIFCGIGPPPSLLEGDHSTSLVAATPLEPPFVMRSPLALFG